MPQPKKTSKPISILCIGIWGDEFVTLQDQGHRVDKVEDGDTRAEFKDYDVIIGEKCWRWLPGISEKWLPQLLKEVRATQPPRVKKVKVKKGDKEVLPH